MSRPSERSLFAIVGSLDGVSIRIEVAVYEDPDCDNLQNIDDSSVRTSTDMERPPPPI